MRLQLSIRRLLEILTITLATAGRKTVVHGRHSDVGQRFHSDFQVLENWTMREDVLDELGRMEISPDFEEARKKEPPT
jgi:hypothetical protein